MTKKLLDRFYSTVMPVIPKNHVSYVVGQTMHASLPGMLGRLSVAAFVKAFHINMDEAEFPIEHYRTVGELFTRRLKPGARPIADGIVHPVDARLTQVGRIHDGILIQCKGKSYQLMDLLNDEHLARRFEGGMYLTYYLCPTDYHRVHAPMDGELIGSRYIPGHLWPVNEWSVNNIRGLFAINERVIMEMNTERGLVAQVMVGATNVGKITLSFDSGLVTNAWGRSSGDQVKRYSPSVSIKKGQEMGIFNMGSSVIMLYDKIVAATIKAPLFPVTVRLGEAVSTESN